MILLSLPAALGCDARTVSDVCCVGPYVGLLLLLVVLRRRPLRR